LKITAITQVGINKFENEDRVIVGKTILTNGVFWCDNFNGIVAVADGVGGNNAGAVASHFLANKLGEVDLPTLEAFKQINKTLISKSTESEYLHKMATTLSGIYISNGSASSFHVGNTRIYSLQGGYLKQLTNDNTTVNYLIKTKQLSLEYANAYVNKSEITACFGVDEKLLDIKIAELATQNIFTLLLTSDGVHEYLGIDELEDMFKEYDEDVRLCRGIASKAINNGSCDDISAIIVRI